MARIYRGGHISGVLIRGSSLYLLPTFSMSAWYVCVTNDCFSTQDIFLKVGDSKGHLLRNGYVTLHA